MTWINMSQYTNSFDEIKDINDKYQEYLTSKNIASKEWFKPYQRYNGEILNNSLHGNGFYFLEKDDKFLYDGLFYANKLEGYSQIFYNDGCHFQGLFKDNKRFGPGVLNYPSGEQDVGLWSGFSILRLGGINEENVIPRLASTSIGKLKLLKYRYLVPVCADQTDLAAEILESLDVNENILSKAHELYNVEVKNKNNIFFDKQFYDGQFYHDQDCYIDILLEEGGEEVPEEETIEPQHQIDEECPYCTNLNLDRIRQISEELERIEGKLEVVKRNKMIYSKKVEYCRLCCAPPGYEEHEADEAAACEEQQEDAGTDLGILNQNQSAETMEVISQINASKYASIKAKEDHKDMLVQIEEYLMRQCTCDEAMPVDDLDDLEYRLKMIIRDEVFYETIKEKLKEKLNMHLKKSQETNDNLKTEKLLVNDLLAWNNEQSSMDMLKHTFLHRKSEYMVTFDVSSLLSGNRGTFLDPGIHEKVCVEFLSDCSNGEYENLLKNITEHKLNVNVCDARGNSGIFFAAANSKIDVIRVLVNVGAKLDQVNDEGLTPLCLCLLLYLAIVNKVDSWEDSFLPDTKIPEGEEKEVSKWYPSKSLLSLSTNYEKTNVTLGNKTNLESLKTKTEDIVKEHYLFDTSFHMPEKKKGGKKDKAEKPKKKLQVLEPGELPQDDEKKIHIEQTIGALLDRGANPNIGEVPLPPLFLSIFTGNKNLVRRILDSRADPNVKIDENLTGLHVIVSLKYTKENIDICEVLLSYNSDPNLKTSVDHWLDQKKKILGKNVKPEDVVDFGKNPLHLLSIRRDFLLDECQYFENLAFLLSESNIELEETYLGHTALSLAVLVGNKNLVEKIIDLKVIDPLLPLGYNMGNVLTVYILKRYEDMLPENCKEVLSLMVEMGVNPLKSVGDFDNTIEFMEKEHEIIKVDKGKKGKEKSSKGSKKESKKGSKKTSKKGSKKGGKKKGISQNEMKEYLKELARETIIRCIQMEAVKNLYNFVEAYMLECNFPKILAEFLIPPLALTNLAALFNHGKIKMARFDKDICLKLMGFVDKYKKVVKAKKEKDKKDKKGKNGKSKKSDKSSKSKGKKGKSTTQLPIPEPEPTMAELIDATDFKKHFKVKSKVKLLKPGLDNTSKYKVCYHCLKKNNKVLLACPRCQLIYFCSEQCNKASIKLKTQHTCHMNYYKAEKACLDAGKVIEDQENLQELCTAAREFCEEKLRLKIQEELEIKQRQLEEERKSDIYGTRFFKKPIGKVAPKTVEAKEVEATPKLGKKRSTDISMPNSKVLFTHLGSDVVDIFTTDDTLFKGSHSQELTMLSLKRDSSLKEAVVVAPVAKKKVNKLSHKKKGFMLESNIKKKIDRLVSRENNLKDDQCECIDTIIATSSKTEGRVKRKSATTTITTNTLAIRDDTVPRLEAFGNLPEPEPIVRKLRKIPSKYQHYIEVLSHYFPDVDFSFLFMPYACYSNGHLFYKFSDKDIFSRTYSMM